MHHQEKFINLSTKILVRYDVRNQKEIQPYQVEYNKVITFDELSNDYHICSGQLKNANFDMKAVAKFIEKNMILVEDK